MLSSPLKILLIKKPPVYFLLFAVNNVAGVPAAFGFPQRQDQSAQRQQSTERRHGPHRRYTEQAESEPRRYSERDQGPAGSGVVCELL